MTNQMEITRRIEFDSGHRVPSHKSLCRNFHGHRYRLEVTVRGVVLPVRGESDDGMVLDFGDVKRILNEEVVSRWDHAFLVYEGDVQGCAALDLLGEEHRTVRVPFIPTAENMVKEVARLVELRLFGGSLLLTRVRLFETPNCWADWTRPVEEHNG